MKAIIDANILHYIGREENNPLDIEKTKSELKSFSEIKVLGPNLAEFYLTSKLNVNQKNDVIDFLLSLNVFIDGLNSSDSKNLLSNLKIELNSDYALELVEFRKKDKIDFEHKILIELTESLVGIFCIFLNIDDPLKQGKQSVFFIRQTEALLRGNNYFTDSEIFKALISFYDTEDQKSFSKEFITYTYTLVYISIMNFSASKLEILLTAITEKNTLPELAYQFNEYLEKNKLFSKIHKILSGKTNETNLPFEKSKENLKIAIKEYSQYLLDDGYPKSYVKNIAIIFENIFLVGQKLEKNDVIDNHLFLYLEDYQLLTMEKGIRGRLKLINEEQSEYLENFIKRVKKGASG